MLTLYKRTLGLLQNLDDCGSPPLAYRAQSLSRPTSLKTSDPKSMMAFMGLPLDLFGKVRWFLMMFKWRSLTPCVSKDAFFQPYLPLQQLDMLKDTGCWLCGSTNSIVTQQKEIDLLVNVRKRSKLRSRPSLLIFISRSRLE